ncbi:hypothetical protein L596_028940 [Steinernema carpocapsae]|uniref:H/ACA ribonucleoprotein complex subunit n=1 Tax=Steinernema carpocapsae TaxID=34508 RepID=A0A4U5LZU9_STECR|nr:hypothetical protein L596_028940 [Steinernema carpocapsae]
MDPLDTPPAGTYDEAGIEDVKAIRNISMGEDALSKNAELFSEEHERKVAEDNRKKLEAVIKSAKSKDLEILAKLLTQGLNLNDVISFDGSRVFMPRMSSGEDGEDQPDSDPEIDQIMTAGPKGGNPKGSTIPIEREYEDAMTKTAGSVKDMKVPEAINMMTFGYVDKIINRQLIVKKILDVGTLDLDTVVFNDHREPIGKIEDVIGPVVDPLYVVVPFGGVNAFNVGTPLFCVPGDEKYANFVFYKDLLKVEARDDSYGGNESDDDEIKSTTTSMSTKSSSSTGSRKRTFNKNQ